MLSFILQEKDIYVQHKKEGIAQVPL